MPEMVPPQSTIRSSTYSEIRANINDDLKVSLQEKMGSCGLFESEDDKGHHHAERKPSIVTAAASGLVNYLLMFGMSCAYGIIIFSDDHNRMHVPLAIKINLSTAFLIGILCAVCSKVPVAIGGPDINPAVFLGLFVEAIAPAIAEDLGLVYPESSARRLMDLASGRALLISSAEFCTGQHEVAFRDECQQYHDQLTATTIFAIAVSTVVMGLVFFMLGSFKLTRYMAYVPTSIMEAFLACVGYKVFAEAVKQSEYMPSQFVPAALIGISMYFLKAKHIGNPAILMPLGFLVPLSAFFAGTYAVGSNVEEVRGDGLMFPKVDNVDFWEVWTSSVGKPENISIKAWTQTLPDLAIMVIVVTLDCVLKVSATDTKMPLHVDKDYEVRLHGINNLLTAPFGHAVGYMQLKFNVINYGIIGNTSDRKPGIIYASLCAICYFYTIEPFNYLPRFFISSLLFFAGSGFVAENLWGSRGTNSSLEWLEILLIVGVFVLTGQLVIAVAVGGAICFITFILKYAKISVMDGLPQRGGECVVVERRGPLMQRNIRHVMDHWLLVVRLKGYIFFASADSLTSHLMQYIQDQQDNNIPHYRRLKYLVFDCSMLDGIDASAAKSIKRLQANAGKGMVRVVWTHLTPAFASELRMRGLLKQNSKDVFNDIEEVVMQVESAGKAYLQNIERKWVSLHPCFAKWAKMSAAQFKFEPFSHIFFSPMYRIGTPWKYCTAVPLHGHSTLLFMPGQSDGFLYLIHSGAVALFEELPEAGQPWPSPVAVYRQGWFLNREVLMSAPSRYYAVAVEEGEVLCWSQHQWWKMACERPLMMSEMLKAAMKQQARDSDSFDAHIHDTVPAGMSDDAVWHLVHENLDIRRQHSGMSEVTPTKSKKNLPPPSLPEEAQVKMTAIEIAQSLEMFGFYMPGQDGEETILPALPPSLKADITMAFAHYATDMGGESHDFAISPSDALPAMMYAGLFHSAQVYDVEQQPTTPLSEETFVGLCHRALMTPLTSSQVKTARDLFGIPDDESASYALSASGLQRSLRKILVGVSAEMADAYFIAFHRSGDVSDNLDINAVLGIMALLVRLHAPYCELLRACREILGLEKCDSSLDVECSRIVRASLQGGDPIAEEDAEEMLWSADWRLCGSGEGQRLGFPEMVSAITATFNREAGPLPPSQSQAEQEVLEEAEIFASPSAMELGTDKNWEALVADISRKHLPPASVSSKNLTDAFGKGVELSPPPHVPTGHDYGGEPDQKVRMQSGETSMSEVHISTQEKLKEAAVSFLIVLSTAALVLEPVISGKEDEQTQAEEQVWGIVELLITAFLTVEALTRFIILAKLGFAGSGQSTATLVVEVLATLPLYMEWVARASVLKEPLGGMLHDGLVDGAELFRVVRFARVSRFAAKTTLAAPVATMLVVVWGVYVKHGFSGK
mmetsp:Transcript_40459/g.93012  ORF Transcript_40459/g.93012 Transcript_40459/m.93012 type:complete len:1420 (+) Transcript_40459:129-4388(+)